MKAILIVLWAALLLAACSSQPSRYALEHDVEPEGEFDVSNIPLLTPVWEPLSRQGNASSYKVRGKRYNVMAAEDSYSEQGVASWYGLKFHGELTSNGEIYDMYSFSAAHKHLPLPSYVEVTNLQNGKTLVVRVNDRGPFHSDRIIDLSYAAAIKLGFKDQGTAPVTVRRILLTAPSELIDKTKMQNDRLASFIQVAAFGSRDSALGVLKDVKSLLNTDSVFVADSVTNGKQIYRVRVGPFDSESAASDVMRQLNRAGLGNPQLITRSVKNPNT